MSQSVFIQYYNNNHLTRINPKNVEDFLEKKSVEHSEWEEDKV